MKQIILTCIFLSFMGTVNAFSQGKILSEQLMEDYSILENAICTIHPGLYKYHDEIYVKNNFRELKNNLQKDLTLEEAYLVFSKFVSKIKCGHTLVNPYNQSETVKKNIFERSDKLPFTFHVLDKRIIIERNLSGDERFGRGVEIVAINGVETSMIIDSLLSVGSADGNNMGQRLHNLQLTGIGEFEDMDIYLPLFFPAENGQYRIEAVNLQNNLKIEARLNSVSRKERFEKMEKKYGPLATNYDDLWEFKIIGNKVGYLKLGTFVTYKMKLDWKKFIDESFQKIKEKNIKDIVIDIRGNGGGMDDVSRYLGKYLLEEAVQIDAVQTKVKYQTVPTELRPYMGTWDKSFYDFSGKVKPDGNGYFLFKKERKKGMKIKPTAKKYTGNKWLLIDGANSSATFILAELIKQNKIATLVGEPTGGNKKGINGGGMFFLGLPNSKIEVDIPIYGNYPLTEQPDAGVEPDVLIKKTVADILEGKDSVLEFVLGEVDSSQP